MRIKCDDCGERSVDSDADIINRRPDGSLKELSEVLCLR